MKYTSRHHSNQARTSGDLLRQLALIDMPADAMRQVLDVFAGMQAQIDKCHSDIARKNADVRELARKRKQKQRACHSDVTVTSQGQEFGDATKKERTKEKNISLSPKEKGSLKRGTQKERVERLCRADIAAGEIAADTLASLPSQSDNASAVHDAAETALVAAGFDVVREQFVIRDDGDRNGRFDLVASKDGGSVAIEIDARKPRQNSIEKLHHWGGYRLVALRGVSDADAIDGIDQIVGIAVTAKGRKSGTELPPDWVPNEGLIIYGNDLGLSDKQINDAAEEMRLWAGANSNRAVARKADWDRTFQGWMRRESKQAGNSRIAQKARQTEAGMRRDRQNAFFDTLNAKLDAMEEPDVPRPCAPMLADRSENAFDVSAPDGPRAGSLCGGDGPPFGRVPGRDD